jgi:hypothetical protein
MVSTPTILTHVMGKQDKECNTDTIPLDKEIASTLYYIVEPMFYPKSFLFQEFVDFLIPFRRKERWQRSEKTKE